MTPAELHSLKDILAPLKLGTPQRIGVDALIGAADENRISDQEFCQIIQALTQQQHDTLVALDKCNDMTNKYINAAEGLVFYRDVAQQSVFWLNDPLVKPIFILSTWIERLLNWLFRKREIA